jgi:hypothetical protein
MKRFVILSMLILALTAIARAQGADPCPDCNKARDEVMFTPSNATDDGQWRSHRWRSFFYMRFSPSIVVTNDSAKKIRQITWESTLINSATKQPISTYTLVSRKRIAPHEVVTLTKKVEVPLDPRVISASQITVVKSGAPNVIQTDQVSRVVKIEYTDGSVSTP